VPMIRDEAPAGIDAEPLMSAAGNGSDPMPGIGTSHGRPPAARHGQARANQARPGPVRPGQGGASRGGTGRSNGRAGLDAAPVDPQPPPAPATADPAHGA